MTAAEQHLYHEPLMAGERMDQPTFHARYEASDPKLRAELIGGAVYLMTPVSLDHARPNTAVLLWLGEFERAAPGTELIVETTVVLGPHSEPQPDACLRILESCGGRSRPVAGYLHGAPELVVEIAVSSQPQDLNEKKTDYEQAGVAEYLVILPERQQALWFHLVEGRYAPVEPGADGILRSRGFPGLWLDPTALFAYNRRRVSEALQLGLASPEHQEWAAEMRRIAADQE